VFRGPINLQGCAICGHGKTRPDSGT
jgi:hypothetical protein